MIFVMFMLSIISTLKIVKDEDGNPLDIQVTEQ